jgi:mRNA interferase HigB
VIVVGKKRLLDFAARHPPARGAIAAWVGEAEGAEWRSPQDIKQRFATASFVGDSVVFNIRGNNFRLDVQVNYATQVMLVKRMGTHAEYNTWKF